MRVYIHILFIQFLSLFISSHVHAQGKFSVDAGNDLHFCTEGQENNFLLNAQVNIQNGVAPYQYAWECKVDLIVMHFTASDILNDSTLLYPTIKEPVSSFNEEKTKFILNVTDANGNKAMDSILVGFTRCSYVLGYIVKEINKGDSIWLDAGSPHGSIKQLYWEPSYGLSNPDSSATWCNPEVNAGYSVVAVDTFGCTCTNYSTEIRIKTPNSKSELNLAKDIKPIQKSSAVVFRNVEKSEASIAIFSSDGKLVHQCIVKDDHIDLSGLLTKKGIYIVKVSLGNEVEVCKFLMTEN